MMINCDATSALNDNAKFLAPLHPPLHQPDQQRHQRPEQREDSSSHNQQRFRLGERNLSKRVGLGESSAVLGGRMCGKLSTVHYLGRHV
jgi:hypothetical protein